MTTAVGIFFFRPWLGAGTTTFTAHLFKALELARAAPMIYRVADRPLPGVLPFGDYEGVVYKNIGWHEALAMVKSQPTIMGATSSHPHVRHGIVDRLLAAGMRAVVHDDGEAAERDWKSLRRPICVRQAVVPLIPGSVWLPHPYMRAAHQPAAVRAGAVSIARVAASKRTNLILDANRLLAPPARVQLLGMDDRLYSKSLAAPYADVYTRNTLSGPVFPLTFDAPVSSCSSAAFAVDMSWFARDGGGTQYAQLEAMDAGAVNVMHEDWFRFPGDLKPGVHVITVDGAQRLADVIAGAAAVDVHAVARRSAAVLRAHNALTVGHAYLEELMSGA